MFKNKIILITGGTGSFGNAVLKRLLKEKISEIRILSRDEKKQEDLRNKINNKKVKFYIGDVRDYRSVLDSIKGVDYVFHAAALKQVPSCEFYPMEAVKTNIIGAENVLNAVIDQEVKRCVVLSTDKAVYPINAMGMTKALMEKIMISKSRQCNPKKTIICATRYGNVMATRGSVIPLFVKQILSGKPITITNLNMTRFLMSVEESVDLVYYAFAKASPGDIFIHKAPACTIKNLLKALKDLLNKNNVEKIIGIRHGEKVHETLVSKEEMIRAQDLKKYFRISADGRDLNYSKYFTKGEISLNKINEFNSSNAKQLNVKQIKTIVKKLNIKSLNHHD